MMGGLRSQESALVCEGRKSLPLLDWRGEWRRQPYQNRGEGPPRELELQQSVLAEAGGAVETEREKTTWGVGEIPRCSLPPTLHFNPAPPIGRPWAEAS